MCSALRSIFTTESIELLNEQQQYYYDFIVQPSPNDDEFQCTEITCGKLGRQIGGHIKELLDVENRYLSKLRLFPILANRGDQRFFLFTNMKTTIDKYAVYILNVRKYSNSH